MTGSTIEIAFDNVASHISNIELVRALVDEISKLNLTFDAMIETLEQRLEDVEVTLRTDIRILINECRHLERRTMDR